MWRPLTSGALGGRHAVRGARRSKGWNIADDSYVIADGSGLSRYNYVTSDALVRILQRMRADPKHASAFAEALPVPGAMERCRRGLREPRPRAG